MLKVFRELKYRNFRLFFPGLAISQIGIWMQNVAVAWLVYDMTKSPLTMGTILCFNAVPLFIVTPFAGVLVDKFNKQKFLFIIQLAFALQALLMTLVSCSGIIQIWNIIVLGVFLNTIAAVDAPLRQATFIYLVDDDNDLGNAISLNASYFNIARLLGPALAGLIIACIDVKACFLINFLCLMPSVFLVSRMHIKEKKYAALQKATIFEGLKEGLCYVFKNYQINILLRFKFVFSFIVLTHSVLIPMYSKDVLHSDADVLGLLMSMAGIGVLCSSLYFAGRTSAKGLKKFLFIGTVLAGISFAALGSIHSVPLNALFMLGVGIGMNAYQTPNNMLLQTVVDNDKRGRVMSINALCNLGTTSMSNFIAGSIAELFGIAQTFIIFGCLLFLAAVYFGFKLHTVNFVKKERE